MEPTSAASQLARDVAVRPSRFGALVEAMRPRQWTKNVFVFAGIVFSGRLFDAGAELRALVCFVAFCAAASATYLGNDIADRDADAHHPLKRLRAVASGRLPLSLATAGVVILGLLGLAGAALLNGKTLAITGGYLAITFAYNLRLKNVFLVDALVVAAGFVLRAAAGAAAIDAEISPWLLVCSFLLALFLALGKRRAELVLLGRAARSHRAALGHYSIPLLDSWLTALSGAAIVCYALYTQSERTVEHFHTANLLYTVPFVIYALFRYQHHVVHDDEGGDPGAVLLGDRALWLALLGWAVTAAVVIYR